MEEQSSELTLYLGHILENKDLQVAFVIATRRIEWSQNDLRRAQDHNIIVITR